jgi:hypothetical protein
MRSQVDFPSLIRDPKTLTVLHGTYTAAQRSAQTLMSETCRVLLPFLMGHKFNRD